MIKRGRQEIVRLTVLIVVIGWGGLLFAQHVDVQKAESTAASRKSGLPTDAAPGGTTAAAAVDKSYLIGPRDVLQIEVWKEKDLSGTVPVRPDGKISLPLLADVQAAGLTAMQLSADITEKLKKYVADPNVTVVVEQVNSREVYVLGEVKHPGAFPLNPRLTVLQAIAKAGGLTPFAHKKKIEIKRAGGVGPQHFNYDKAIKGKSADADLQPGDTIIVP